MDDNAFRAPSHPRYLPTRAEMREDHERRLQAQQYRDSPAMVVEKARQAVDHCDELLAAAAIRRRTGSWDPNSAANARDWETLDRVNAAVHGRYIPPRSR